VASLAHEINNCTNTLLDLLFLIEAAAEIKPSDSAHVYLEHAEDEVRRVSYIARAVIDNEVSDNVVHNIDIQQLLSSVTESYKSRLDLRGVSILVRFRSDGICVGHREALRQVFSSLLLNAADAVPAGGKILVRARQATEPSGQHRRGTLVTIGDNGKGIRTEDLSRIWEPSFSTKGAAGIGIGLSLVKRTVQQHQGTVRVRSSTKQGCSGTVFTIFLPSAAA
jgi:signal transduction histidine kinase